MEGLGAPTPGTMTLTTRLSKPFQQIERYSNLLKELERHSEVSRDSFSSDCQTGVGSSLSLIGVGLISPYNRLCISN